MHDCLIAFGSNEGRSTDVFEQALFELSQISDLRVSTHSNPLTTEPVGGPKDQEPFLNAAIGIQTSRSPFEVHQCLVEIESKLGRIRRERWGPRKIDLDLLLFDQLRIETEDLIIPHPRMSFRRFVLEPASEIAADMIHVTSGRTIAQLVQHLNEREDLIIYVSDGLDDDPLSQIGTEVPAPWKFQTVTVGELGDYESRAKLVAYVLESAESRDVKTPPFQSNHISFPGPTLEIPANSELAKIEILAAIEAMTPLESRQ